MSTTQIPAAQTPVLDVEDRSWRASDNHGYAAVLYRGLQTGETNPVPEFPTRIEGRVRTAIQPRSTGFELAKVLRGFTPLVPRVHLPVPLAGPAPSGSAGASRRCRGCSPSRPVVSPTQTAPSFYRLAATKRRRGSFTLTRSRGASWRTAPLLHRIRTHDVELAPFRQLRGEKVRFTSADRVLLAALLHRLPGDVSRRIRLLVRPETVLRRHRDLLARRHAPISRPKRAGRRTHDYVRHGTTNLFAALEVHSGQVHADCFPRGRTVEFLAFMDRVVAAYPPSSSCTSS